MFFDDFHDMPTGKYTATQAGAVGTFTTSDEVGGVGKADSGSTTVTQGINIQLGGTAAENFLPDTDDVIYFEGRFKLSGNSTGPELFIGLTTTDTTIIGSSALTVTNYIGFKSLTDDSVLIGCCKDGTTEQTVAAVQTMAADTYYKLGFKVTGTSRLEFFVNGVLNSTAITANIPTTEMRISFVCQSSGTTQPILYVDWVRAAQVINP